MRTILFITDLYAGSRVPMLTGVREVCSQLGMHVEEIELCRIDEPIENVVEYWNPSGCILEGSGKSTLKSDVYASIPVVHIDPDDKNLEDPAAFTVTNDSDRIADLAVAARTAVLRTSSADETPVQRDERLLDLRQQGGLRLAP